MKTKLGSKNAVFELLESSGAGHLILNQAMEIVWANKALDRFFGLDQTKLKGMPLSAFMRERAPKLIENHEEVAVSVLEAHKSSQPIDGLQIHLRAIEGRPERWLELWSQLIESGEFSGGRLENFYDVTAIKQTEYRLALLTAAVEQGTEGVILLCQEGKLVFANAAFARMHGYSLDEVFNSHIHQFRRKEDVFDFREEIRMVEESGFVTGQGLHVTKSGGVIPVSVAVSVVRDSAGKTKGFLCTCRDTTEQSKSERELRESRRTLLTLMSNLPGMAYRCQNNPAWTMEFVSAGCFALTGYQAEELQFNQLQSFNDLIHLDDRNQVWDHVQIAVQKREPFKLNYRILTKDEKLKWVWEQGQGVYGDDGELLALEGFITDITERKRIEDALQESEGKFRRLAETTNAIIFIYQEAKLIYANPAAVKVTGYTANDMNHMDFWEIIHPDQRDEVRLRGMSRLGGIEVSSRYETKILTKAGDTVWIDYAGTTIEYGGGPAILGTAFEITERKLAENRLRAATRELRQDRQKLSEKNTALKQILEHLENERQEFKQEISQEIENAVSPYLRRLKAELGDENKELKALEENLQAIIRKDIDLFKERYIRLTPRELEICDMIRKSLSSKQISQELNLSVATVQKHREQIRKKLAITNKSINLGSYLRSHRAI